jgi:heat shock protein HspQ
MEENAMTTETEVPCRFSPGELIRHLTLGVRGVVVEVDDCFRGDERAYRNLAGSKPNKDQPWYHILVDGEDHITYFPEQSLETDVSGEPVIHPMITHMFHSFENGRYSRLLH